MKIISWNVNGIRSAYKQDFSKWLAETDAEIVCLQEVKAQEEQISALFPANSLFASPPYHLYLNPAMKRGYSGIVILAKEKPLAVKNTLGVERFDTEGRILELAYPNFTLISIYLPHGGRQKENLQYKLEAYNRLREYLKKSQNRGTILVGDFNVAHTELDLARPKENQNNTMFTSEERKCLDEIQRVGFIDSFRVFSPEGGHYTWWPYATNARQRNLGWRIDYIFISRDLISKLKSAFILSHVPGSDHCPIGVEIEI